MAECRLDGKALELAIWDMGSQEQYERLRPLVYLNTHAILLCFSIDDYDSLDNIKNKVGKILLEATRAIMLMDGL